MTPKDLCSRFFNQCGTGWKDVAFQMKIAKDLVEKYEDDDLIFALDYYKDSIYSLGFLSPKNMGIAIQKRKNAVQFNYEVGEENVAERNRIKLQNAASESKGQRGVLFRFA